MRTEYIVSGKSDMRRAFLRRFIATGIGLNILLIAFHLAACGAPDIVPDIADYAVKVEDISATLHVVKFDPLELEKIGSDIKTTYALRVLNLTYKQPDKIRLEGHSPTRGHALMILNGANRYVLIPRFHIHDVQNLEKAPGKRQSILEFGGIVSPTTMQFMSGRFLREENTPGHAYLIFEMHYQGAAGGSYYRLWMDPKTHITTRREWFDSASKLRATFQYEDPREVAPGIWLPTRMEVHSPSGALAASMTMDNLKVNQQVPDSLFSISDGE